MKHLLVGAALIAGLLGSSTWAQTRDKPVVLVELFTSQGCYSCPPADKILHKLSKEKDILALSLHVDYWDYIGWKDIFAIPKFGERQASYNAQIINRSRRVTPQMIFNGMAEVAGGVGRSALRIDAAVDVMRKHSEPAGIEINRDGQMVNVTLTSKVNGLGLADVSLVKYTPSQTVDIKRGENAGKKITYTNIVRSLEVIARWDPKRKGTLEFDLPDNGHYALIVQGKRFGPVYVARRIPR